MNHNEQLRSVIEAELKKQNKRAGRLASEAGVDHGNLWRFLHHERSGVNFETAAKLITTLGVSFSVFDNCPQKGKA